MLGFALNSKRLKDRLMDSSSLVGEVNIEWARTMNKIIFDEACKRGSSGCAATLMPMTDMPLQVRQRHGVAIAVKPGDNSCHCGEHPCSTDRCLAYLHHPSKKHDG